MANIETTCQHGRAGFCWDDATPEQRKAYGHLHRHAYTWALGYGRDEAEQYASRFAAENWRWPDEAGSHSHERYVALVGAA